MARDEGKGMMGSMQMDKEKELPQQHPQQQQPQLPGAATPDPWPPPMSADLDESNGEPEIGRHDFLVFVLGGRAAAGRVVCVGKKQSEGKSERWRAGWKRF